MMSSFGQTFFISVFAGQIRSEFDISHGEWGMIYAVGTTVSAFVMIWAGVASDHFRVRQLGRLIIIGLALSCLFMAFNTAPVFLVLSVFLLRFFGQGMLSHLATVAMARWFVATRGKALAISGLGIAFCEAVLPIATVAIMSAGANWRTLWIIAAAFLLISLPLLGRLLTQEREPKQIAQETRSAGMAGKHWTRTDAIRHPLFWLVFPTLLGPSAFITAFFFHQVHVAEVKGWSHLQFVSLFPAYTCAGIAVMLLSGWALDRFGTRPIYPLFQIPMALGFALFAYAPTPWVAMIAIILIGFASGTNATVSSAFWAEVYGTAHIGAIKALASAAMVLGSAIGPGLTGYLIDIGIGIERQFVGIAIWFLVAAAILTVGVIRYSRPSP